MILGPYCREFALAPLPPRFPLNAYTDMVDVTSLRTPEKKKKKRRRPRRGAKVASRRMALQVQVCNLDIEGPCVHRVHVDMRVSCYFSSIAFSGETQSAVKTSTFCWRIRAPSLFCGLPALP